jgi:undecaprenyl-diphosphatase
MEFGCPLNIHRKPGGVVGEFHRAIHAFGSSGMGKDRRVCTSRWWESLNGVEARLIVDSPALPATTPHTAIIAITTAARGGALWLALCAFEALRAGGDRRAARHGAVSVVAALAVSQLLKRVTPYRPRPEPPGGRARRALPERPDSSSFPSAHAATAAAFTAAAFARDRRLAIALMPLPLVATYGRLRTRVHWPTDLVTGVVIGITTATVLDRYRV